jgi:hypothetical protein
MNGSRAATLKIDAALTQASVIEVNLVGGYWGTGDRIPRIQRVSARFPNAPVTVGRVDDQGFELLIPIPSSTKSLNPPFGLI